MWIQLDSEVFEKLAILAKDAKLMDAAGRILHSLQSQRERQTTFTAYRYEARKQFGREGELEIDDDAAISEGDEFGAYVMAWRWVETPMSMIPGDVCEPRNVNGGV